MFVEAHTRRRRRLDDAARRERPHHDQATGQSCPARLAATLHPQLDALPDAERRRTCTPTGTTGAWNAASRQLGRLAAVDIDLAAYAGKTVEVSIAYASDWATQGLGVFVDDIAVSTGEGSTSFESGLDGWTVTQPSDSAPNANNFVRLAAGSFPEAAVVDTETRSIWVSAWRASPVPTPATPSSAGR